MTNRVFNATLDSVNTNKTKTVIKLSLSNKEAAVFAQRYLNSIDKELRVSFDDPQMEMNIAPASGSSRGLVATISQDGVVESTHREEDGEQADLFVQDSFSDGSGDSEGDSRMEEDDESEGDPDEAAKGEKFGEGSEVSEEIEFEDGDATDHSDDSKDDDSKEMKDDAPELDAEALEAYILSEEPAFDAIPFNFPEMIRRIRENAGVRWMDIAKESGIPSTKLQSIYRKYKELVVEQMRAQGVA